MARPVVNPTSPVSAPYIDAMVTPVRIVIDTSVLVAASRSRQGASFALLQLIPTAAFQPCLSVALYVE